MEINVLLTHTAVLKLKFTSNRYRKTDYDGLIIEVSPSQSKIWKYRYSFDGKRKMITLGHFPQIGLSEARQLRNEAKSKVFNGTDPGKTKSKVNNDSTERSASSGEVSSQDPSFCEVFDIFARRKTTQYGNNKPEWSSNTYSTHLKRLSKHVFPFFGDYAINKIDTDLLQERLLSIQKHGTLETRDKIHTIFKQVFDYAKACKLIQKNPVLEISTALFAKKNSTNYKHVTTKSELKEVIQKIDSLKGGFEIVSCIQLSMHIFLRASEISGMRWDEVDFDSNVISRETTKSAKTNEPKVLLIPMSTQVVNMLKELHVFTGHTEYVFKSQKTTGHIDSGSLNKNIRDNGLNGQLTLHGMRHTASTFLHEMDFNSDDIELQLNHEIKGIRGVYNKAKRLEPRRLMMQAWSDLLAGLN